MARSSPPMVLPCQHNCTVEHLATELPDLCTSEAELFERLLGTRVERETTIVDGAVRCETRIDLGASEPRTTPNHHVTEPQGSKEPSLMATEARDPTPEAPERINPVPENVDLGRSAGWHDPVNSVFTPSGVFPTTSSRRSRR